MLNLKSVGKPYLSKSQLFHRYQCCFRKSRNSVGVALSGPPKSVGTINFAASGPPPKSLSALATNVGLSPQEASSTEGSMLIGAATEARIERRETTPGAPTLRGIPRLPTKSVRPECATTMPVRDGERQCCASNLTHRANVLSHHFVNSGRVAVAITHEGSQGSRRARTRRRVTTPSLHITRMVSHGKSRRVARFRRLPLSQPGPRKRSAEKPKHRR